MEAMYKVRDSLQDKIDKKERSDLLFLFVLGLIIIAMTVMVFLYSVVFFNVVVDGPSMQPTLYTGDVLVASKNKKAERGSLIVIDGVKWDSVNKEYVWLIKRAIAFGGDTVQIKEGSVYVNGDKLDEPYISIPNSTVDYDDIYDWNEPTVVAEGQVFYLGDNRTNSSDSRVYGTCSEENIVGVVSDWSLSARGFNKFLYDTGKIFRGEE